MKTTYLILLFVLFAACQNEGGMDSSKDSMTAEIEMFEQNAAVIQGVLADFESEDDRFFTHFDAESYWASTGVNGSDSIPFERMKTIYHSLWEQYDYEMISDVNLLPGVNPNTKQVDGSVRGYFEWKLSKPATDSTDSKSVTLWIYESFDFKSNGKIGFTQVYGNLEAAYAKLEE